MLIYGLAIGVVATLVIAIMAVIDLLLYREYAILAFKGPAQVDRFVQAMIDEKRLELYDERAEEIAHAAQRMVIPYLLPTMSWWLVGMLVHTHYGVPLGLDPALDITMWVVGAIAIASTVFVLGLVLQTAHKLRSEKSLVASVEDAALAPTS